MEFNQTEEQKIFCNEIIKFAKENLNDSDKLDEFSYEMWNKVAEFGLFGLNVDESLGGMGESYLTSAMVIEALGYACKNNGFVFAINNHIWVALNLIYLYGSDELKEKYLSSMIDGTKIGAFALTEADSGSDATNMKTNAVKEEDHYILNGSKMFISNGTIADLFMVVALTSEKPYKQFTVFVVEKDMEGVEVSQDIKKLGLDACPTAELILHNVKIPQENVLGKFNRGTKIFTSALEWERCYECAPCVGAMKRIVEECLRYANTRKQFGKEIGEYQAVSHKIANMQVAYEMSRLMLYKIAWMKDMKKNAFYETAVFKLFVSEHYVQVCRDALQIFGAYGYTKEYDIEREVRDALATTIYSGTSEMQRNTIYSLLQSEYI